MPAWGATMPYYEVHHTWKPEMTPQVVESVKKWVSEAEQGMVPSGFKPIIMAAAVPGKAEARCTWEAPDREQLEALYQEKGIPTIRVIREVTPFLTR